MYSKMRLLLISNSTNAGEGYLEHPLPAIGAFLKGIDEVLFIPYAGVSFSYDEYEAKVGTKFAELGLRVRSVHRELQPVAAVMNAKAIVIGGGNTWHLLDQMQKQGILAPIREKALAGTPYIGWSAGSNVACPTIRTTNDMPIVEPQSFNALNLVPFQINPHYLDATVEGHAGESREDRIIEFMVANPNTRVLGLREGCYLLLEKGNLTLHGPRTMRLFKQGEQTREINDKESLQFLLD